MENCTKSLTEFVLSWTDLQSLFHQTRRGLYYTIGLSVLQNCPSIRTCRWKFLGLFESLKPASETRLKVFQINISDPVMIETLLRCPSLLRVRDQHLSKEVSNFLGFILKELVFLEQNVAKRPWLQTFDVAKLAVGSVKSAGVSPDERHCERERRYELTDLSHVVWNRVNKQWLACIPSSFSKVRPDLGSNNRSPVNSSKTMQAIDQTSIACV